MTGWLSVRMAKFCLGLGLCPSHRQTLLNLGGLFVSKNPRTNSADHFWSFGEKFPVIASHRWSSTLPWLVSPQKNSLWIPSSVLHSLLVMPRISEVLDLGCCYSRKASLFSEEGAICLAIYHMKTSSCGFFLEVSMLILEKVFLPMIVLEWIFRTHSWFFKIKEMIGRTPFADTWSRLHALSMKITRASARMRYPSRRLPNF